MPTVLYMKNSFILPWAQKCVPTVVSLSTNIVKLRRAQKKCDHRSITAYEDTHTTETAKSATLYQYISLFRGIAAKEKTSEFGVPGSSKHIVFEPAREIGVFSLSFFEKKLSFESE